MSNTENDIDVREPAPIDIDALFSAAEEIVTNSSSSHSLNILSEGRRDLAHDAKPSGSAADLTHLDANGRREVPQQTQGSPHTLTQAEAIQKQLSYSQPSSPVFKGLLQIMTSTLPFANKSKPESPNSITNSPPITSSTPAMGSPGLASASTTPGKATYRTSVSVAGVSQSATDTVTHLRSSSAGSRYVRERSIGPSSGFSNSNPASFLFASWMAQSSQSHNGSSPQLGDARNNTSAAQSPINELKAGSAHPNRRENVSTSSPTNQNQNGYSFPGRSNQRSSFYQQASHINRIRGRRRHGSDVHGQYSSAAQIMPPRPNDVDNLIDLAASSRNNIGAETNANTTTATFSDVRVRSARSASTFLRPASEAGRNYLEGLGVNMSSSNNTGASNSTSANNATKKFSSVDELRIRNSLAVPTALGTARMSSSTQSNDASVEGSYAAMGKMASINEISTSFMKGDAASKTVDVPEPVSTIDVDEILSIGIQDELNTAKINNVEIPSCDVDDIVEIFNTIVAAGDEQQANQDSRMTGSDAPLISSGSRLSRSHRGDTSNQGEELGLCSADPGPGTQEAVSNTKHLKESSAADDASQTLNVKQIDSRSESSLGKPPNISSTPNVTANTSHRPSIIQLITRGRKSIVAENQRNLADGQAMHQSNTGTNTLSGANATSGVSHFFNPQIRISEEVSEGPLSPDTKDQLLQPRNAMLVKSPSTQANLGDYKDTRFDPSSVKTSTSYDVISTTNKTRSPPQSRHRQHHGGSFHSKSARVSIVGAHAIAVAEAAAAAATNSQPNIASSAERVQVPPFDPKDVHDIIDLGNHSLTGIELLGFFKAEVDPNHVVADIDRVISLAAGVTKNSQTDLAGAAAPDAIAPTDNTSTPAVAPAAMDPGISRNA